MTKTKKVFDAPVMIAKLRASKLSARGRMFAKLSPEEQLAVTVPCTGEAHSNPHIDHCMICLGLDWGRMLARDVSDDESRIIVTG